MSDSEINGAAGEMGLLTRHHVESQRLVRSVTLSASADGKSVVLTVIDASNAGISNQRRLADFFFGLA